MRKYISKSALATLAVGLVLFAGGCSLQAGGRGVAGTLERLKPLAENCNGPLNGYVGLDLSTSSKGDEALLSTRVEALRDMTDQVAACGGYMKALAFAGSAARTFPLGEAKFQTDSGTETARLIQADKAVDDLMEETEGNLPEALRQLNANGSDILAQLTLAQQYQQQRPTGVLYVGLVTDGIATTEPVMMNTPDFTMSMAQAEAKRVQVPDLADALVRIVGIGKTTGDRQLSTERINAITSFYALACKRTGARCLVTTDYTPGG